MRAILALLLFAPVLHAQTVVYVDADATGAGSGTSWADAFPDLQAALATAQDDDELWVAEGTYRPGTARSATFALPDGVRLFGGFNGTETQRHERNWATNATILSGDIGVPGQASDNSYHVVSAQDGSDSTVLDGFTIEGGNANGNPEPLGDAGGGLFLRNADPVLQNLIVRDNAAPNGAGMMARDGSRPFLSNALLHDNLAGNNGGGIAIIGNGSITLRGSTLTRNVSIQGGAIFGSQSGVQVRNAIFWGNEGGEIVMTGGASASVAHAIVQGGHPGTLVLNSDPGFTAPQLADFTLQHTSPAIDIGSFLYLPQDVHDLDGDGDSDEPLPYDLGKHERVQGAAVDLGAHEWSVASCPSQSRLYVSEGAFGTGVSWSDPLGQLRDATRLASHCPGVQEIWASEGVYVAPSRLPFLVRSPIRLYGGFAGTESSLDERIWDAHPTRLQAFGSSTIVSLADVDEQAVLDGFMIHQPVDVGIHVESGSPMIRNLRITQSDIGILTAGEPRLEALTIADLVHTGIAVVAGTPLILDVLIEEVSHGLSVSGGFPFITDALLRFNHRGLLVTGGAPTLHASTFDGNFVQFLVQGGLVRGNQVLLTEGAIGILLEQGEVQITNSRLEGHRNYTKDQSSSGSALIATGGTLHIANSVFENNEVLADGVRGDGASGGAGSLRGPVTATFTNVLFARNQAWVFSGTDRGQGGALLIAGVLPPNQITIQNSTFAGNWIDPGANARGEAIASFSSALSIENSVFGVPTSTGGLIHTQGNPAPHLAHVLLPGGFDGGEAILDADPEFLRDPHPGPDGEWGTDDDIRGDMHLSRSSPARGFGNADLLPADALDLDGDGNTNEPLPIDLEGHPRAVVGQLDLGAYQIPFPVATEPSGAVTTFALHGAYPNPFNPTTRILFDLPQDGEVTLTLIDVLGREVAVRGPVPVAAGPGRSLTVDGTGLASGLYLFRLTATYGTQSRTASGTVTLLK